MRTVVFTLAFFGLTTNIYGQELPRNLSREPNCIKGTYCLRKDDVFIPDSVPNGFSREPNCEPETICVAKSLGMLPEDFLAIRALVEKQFAIYKRSTKSISEVMDNLIKITIANAGGGYACVVEKKDGKWVILRETSWIF